MCWLTPSGDTIARGRRLPYAATDADLQLLLEFLDGCDDYAGPPRPVPAGLGPFLAGAAGTLRQLRGDDDGWACTVAEVADVLNGAATYTVG